MQSSQVGSEEESSQDELIPTNINKVQKKVVDVVKKQEEEEDEADTDEDNLSQQHELEEEKPKRTESVK